MPELAFQVDGIEPATHGLTPLLHFKLRIVNSSANERIHAVLLQAQIQIEAPKRSYTGEEKERLTDVFGTPERWGQTLRNRFWTHTSTTSGPFTDNAEVILPVPCTCDLNVLATKYFDALTDGEVPLLFLFRGSIFYAADDGHVQVRPIPWNKECVFRLPVRIWKDLMDHHYPNTAWLALRRDIFQRLHAFKRSAGIATWEQTIEQLLPSPEKKEVAA